MHRVHPLNLALDLFPHRKKKCYIALPLDSLEVLMQSKRFSTRELCYIGIFAAIISVCAQVVIPQPGGVPFTLQAWAVALSGLILGPKKGALAALVYVLLGAVGVPVFAGFTGGIGIIMRHTGGFIISFPIMALLSGLGEKKGFAWSVLGLAAGNVFNLSLGLIWFNWVTGLGLRVSFGYAVAPFIIVSVVMIIVLPMVGVRIRVVLEKAGVGL
jgi:biotin transport system substrate-specific component